MFFLFLTTAQRHDYDFFVSHDGTTTQRSYDTTTIRTKQAKLELKRDIVTDKHRSGTENMTANSWVIYRTRH